jgi:diphthine synthase
MLYIIGLGLNEKGYSKESWEIITEADKIFIENYTVEFPYKIKDLEKQFKKKKFILADRDLVESMDEILKDAKNKSVVLLVYGSPFVATTHTSLIQEAKKRKIKTKIIHNASIFDAITETGLQIYKFGKVASMPTWQKSFEPKSFIDIVKDNQKINAHSLILVDICLELRDALNQLEDSNKDKKVKLNKIIICSQLGTKNSKIFYKRISELKKIKIKNPFCIIIPSELHFAEKEFLEEN